MTKRYLKTIISSLLIAAFACQMVAKEGIGVSAEETVVYEGETEEEIYIVNEIEDLRTEYSKSYLQSDGTYVEIASLTPIHYEENGKNIKK